MFSHFTKKAAVTLCSLWIVFFVALFTSDASYAENVNSSDETLLSDSSDLLSDDEGLDGEGLLEEGGSLLGDDDDLLSGDDLSGDDSDSLSTESLFDKPDVEQETARISEANKEHQRLFEEVAYPSASTCATCHPRHYDEWSVSQHAYAQLSPLMLAMQNTINVVTSTANGDFCLRCHAPVGSELNEPLGLSNLDRHPASREGITCVACHRINKNFGKVTGRISLEPGDIFQPVYGPKGNEELEKTLAQPEKFRVTTQPDEPGRGIHAKAERFFELTTPGFCATCHDVFAPNGLRIEEAFSEFKNTPAAKDGRTCQDCHMSKVQGVAAGFDHGPAAIVGDEETTPRKLTNHFFAGPDYSIIHPGIFPHNVKAARFKTMREWLEFDWQAGWGTDAFEDAVADDYPFPDAWVSIDDRYDARAIIEKQQEKLKWAETKRREVLTNAFDLSDIRITQSDQQGLSFEVDVKSISDGHLMPNGFDAERIFFLLVELRDAKGDLVFISGDRDPNGDLRDRHSKYVQAGEVALDEQLFNLQSKFMVRLQHGAEREQVLPSPVSVSVAPYIRPESRPSSLYGRAKSARKHRKGIEPFGHRTARYEVPAEQLTGTGPYQLDIKFISQALPVNLVTTVQVAGFDYNMSPKQVADELVKGSMVIRERSIELDL
ncbi:multiheme c-type cytochrome [Oceanospirillum beijerinckii]|uniref:multiheme c-type cytochrome n=1 Tax=Oceanospirillum beijerinckii TaxID=64976 RepID=UPI0004134601|nr:multiheme c-type cytochrome [Oceanospirillum beijerinckii]